MKIELAVFDSWKEKQRLQEAILSESGQQQLAIRTYKIQLSKQNERMHTLQIEIERAKKEKEEKKIQALEVNTKFPSISYSI